MQRLAVEAVMRVLITWGSQRGGTEGIARMLGEALPRDGIVAVLRPAREVRSVTGFDAVIVGGALYANRWHRDARRFVARHLRGLRRVPVWMFSSGPLDDSADRAELPPPRQVRTLMDRVGARGHVTFGGRLAADAKGFPAAAMARKSAGDWRNPARIAAWATALAQELPTARPGAVVRPPGDGWGRLLGHAVAGWAPSAAIFAALLAAGVGGAIVVHAVLAPVVFAAIAWSYFGPRGARAPAAAAFGFAGFAASLDVALLAALAPHELGGFAATWLPAASIVAVTWLVGAARSMVPLPAPPAATQSSAA
jgi:menaquinone-dependent protoporphyrinogen oxidase